MTKCACNTSPGKIYVCRNTVDYIQLYFVAISNNIEILYDVIVCFIIKTHVPSFFDTDLHEVSWHFATHEAVRPNGFEVQVTEWRAVSKKPFKMGVCFYPTLKMYIKPINRLKTVSKVGDLSSTIAMTAHCFGALSRVRAIGHSVIGQERDLL